MPQVVRLEVELPDDLARIRLPPGVQHCLNRLLDQQDAGTPLNEAEGLVDLAELLSVLRARAKRVGGLAA